VLQAPALPAKAAMGLSGWFAAYVAIAFAYFAFAKAGLTLASINPSATPVWPPTGLAIAAILLLGPRISPAIFAAAWLANQTTTGEPVSSLAIAFGNTLEALVAGVLIERWAGGESAFDAPASVLRFIGICLAVATPVSATIGVSSLLVSGLAEVAAVPAIWTTWWLGDFTGALIVAPAVVLWTRSGPSWKPRLEESLVYLASALIGIIAFSPLLEQTVVRSALAFLAVLPLVWSGLRCGPRQTATVALIIAGFAVWGANSGGGPFARNRPEESFLLLLMFIISICAPGLVLAANSLVHRAALAQKEMLLREVHHRVKNNLQVIASMISLRSRRAPDESRAHFDVLAERVYAMGKVYDQIHKSQYHSEVDLGELLHDLADSARSDRTQVIVDAAPFTIGVETAIPLGLIAIELMMNAVKHAFPESGGTIRVSLRRTGFDRLELTIADDGNGFDPARAPSGSTGLQIVERLVEQIGGSLDTRSDSSGTAHRIDFAQ
jgi:two-component sensor histidine kinase